MSRVFLSTLPKSGTHFLVEFFQNIGLKRHVVEDEIYRILIQLPNLYEINQENIDRLQKVSKVLSNNNIFTKEDFNEQLDFHRQKIVENIIKMPEGYFSYDHYVYDQKLITEIGKASMPIIFLIRDPHDYIVSLTNHIIRHPEHKHFQKFNELKSDEERYLKLIVGELSEDGLYTVTPLARTLNNFTGWVQDPHVMTLHFEEIIGPKGGGKRYTQYAMFDHLMKYISFPVDTDQLYDMVDKSYNTKHTLFIKGQIGQWKEVFSEKVLDTFNTHAGHFLDTFGYEYNGNVNSMEPGLNNDLLKVCLRNADKELNEAYSKILQLEDHNKNLSESIHHLYEDNDKRLKLIHKHEAEIAELNELYTKTEQKRKVNLELIHKHEARINELEALYDKTEQENKERLGLIYKHEELFKRRNEELSQLNKDLSYWKQEATSWSGIGRLILKKIRGKNKKIEIRVSP